MSLKADEDGGYWLEVDNHAGCRMWDFRPRQGEIVTWSGSCTNGKASGLGERVRRPRDQDSEWRVVESGDLVDGKKQGHWIERYDGGQVEEGPYIDGRRQGHWVLHAADGTVAEGPVDSGRSGHWVERFADGTVAEGPYEDDVRQGKWVVRSADGAVDEGHFVDGKRHGHWVLRRGEGCTLEGMYVHGKRQGRWVERTADGTLMSADIARERGADQSGFARGLLASVSGLLGFLGFVGMMGFGFLAVMSVLAFGFLAVASGHLPEAEHLSLPGYYLLGAAVGFVVWKVTTVDPVTPDGKES